jgi:hypothetical protein
MHLYQMHHDYIYHESPLYPHPKKIGSIWFPTYMIDNTAVKKKKKKKKKKMCGSLRLAFESLKIPPFKA